MKVRIAREARWGLKHNNIGTSIIRNIGQNSQGSPLGIETKQSNGVVDKQGLMW